MTTDSINFKIASSFQPFSDIRDVPAFRVKHDSVKRDFLESGIVLQIGDMNPFIYTIGDSISTTFRISANSRYGGMSN